MTSGDAIPSTERPVVPDFVLERYKYILQQIHATNENVYRFLALYQTLATALVAAGVALFVSYRKWGFAADTTRLAIVSLLLLETVVAAFTSMLIVVGILSWLDYRREECELSNTWFQAGFRTPPQLRNLFRWYETYILLFVLVSTGFLWTVAAIFILPHIT